MQPLIDSSCWSDSTVEHEAIGEAQRAEEAEALALGAGTTITNDDSAAHHCRAAARREDLWRGPAWRLRQPDWWHRRAGSPLCGAGLRNGRRHWARGARRLVCGLRRHENSSEAAKPRLGGRKSPVSLAEQVCFFFFFSFFSVHIFGCISQSRRLAALPPPLLGGRKPDGAGGERGAATELAGWVLGLCRFGLVLSIGLGWWT